MAAPRRRRSAHARRREEGAAMLLVMMILLVATTIASMAIELVTLETRSAGYYRQQAQAHYVADSAMAAMLSLTPEDITRRLCAAANNITAPAEIPNLANPTLFTNYGEPNPGYVRPGSTAPTYRMEQGELNAEVMQTIGASVPVREGYNESLGIQAYAPWYTVDFTDFHKSVEVVPGHDASGNATYFYMTATVTVRGRLWASDPTGTVPIPAGMRGASRTVAGQIFQEYTDSAYDTRAVAVFGPSTQCN